MVKSHDLLDIAISHYEDGIKAPEISKLLANKLHRSMIDRWLHRYKQSRSIYVKRKSGSQKDGRTKQRISLVKKDLTPTFLEKVYERWPKISEVIAKRSSGYSILIYIKNAIEKLVFRV